MAVHPPMSSVLPALQAVTFLAIFSVFCAVTKPSIESWVWTQMAVLILKLEVDKVVPLSPYVLHG